MWYRDRIVDNKLRLIELVSLQIQQRFNIRNRESQITNYKSFPVCRVETPALNIHELVGRQIILRNGLPFNSALKSLRQTNLMSASSKFLAATSKP